MSEDILTLIGLSRTGPTRAPFWTRSVPVGGFNAISLIEGKAPDRATLIAICRACSFAMADFVPVAPTRMPRDELALYTCDQCEALRALIDRVGGRQESILTLEWRDHAGKALLAAGKGGDWLHRRVLQFRAGPDRRNELVALAQRLAAPAMALAQARTINAFDGGCDVSLLHSSRDQTALAGKIEAETLALAGPLDAVTAALSGPFPPLCFLRMLYCVRCPVHEPGNGQAVRRPALAVAQLRKPRAVARRQSVFLVCLEQLIGRSGPHTRKRR